MTPHSHRRECAICFTSQYSDNPDSPQRFCSTPCNHHFHFECLERWCHINNSCPTCRAENVMYITDYPTGSSISEIYSIYVNNYNDINNTEPSSSPQDEQPTTSQNNDDQNNNNNPGIINIDSILDNIRNDFNNTGIIRSNNIMDLLNLSQINRTNSTISRNNYSYLNNNENYLLPEHYTNMINQNNITNTNTFRRANRRLYRRRNSAINLDHIGLA